MKRNRGIALFMVMVMAGLLMLLLGAFMQLNRHQFGIMKNDQAHVAATEAARSLFDYCTYRLEHHHQWGASPFQGDTADDVAAYLKLREVDGTHRLQGEVLESGVQFEVDVLNNIEGTAPRDGVPAGSCRLRITTSRGPATVRTEALLSTAPLFDAGVISSKQILVDARSLKVASQDPFRNRLRSKGDIRVPDYNGPFRFDPASDATERGVLWARHGITMGGKDLSDPALALEAAQKTRGQFLPQADTHYEVYDLQLDEVKSPKNSVSVEAGVYIFSQREVMYYRGEEKVYRIIPVLERRDWALNEQNIATGGDVREIWYLTANLPDDATSAWVEMWGDLPEEGMHPQPANTFTLDDGVQVHFNSLDPDYQAAYNTTGDTDYLYQPPTIVINSDVNLEVHGDFGIGSWDGSFNPTIRFADPDTGEVGTTSSGETISGSITARAAGGQDGSIYIEGYIEGNGKLLASGDVTLRNTYADVSTDTQSDLSIYSGGTVRVLPKRAAVKDENSEFKYDQSKQGRTAFRGLIFAAQDVFFESNIGDEEGAWDPGDIYVEGAVVAREGAVHVYNAGDVTFKYNPEFLDTILNPRKENRIRLEPTVWKQI